MPKILVVEDDADIRRKLVEWLKHEFHTVESAADGTQAENLILNYHYDLIILDWELPGLSGPELCRKYRDAQGMSPVLMLTGKFELNSKEVGFSSGVDDYLTKPFHFRELSMRVQALLRRPAVISPKGITIADITLCIDTHEVMKNGQKIELTPKEFALLELFMKHPGETFSPDALLDMVWKSESDSGIETLRTTIKNLRKKITAENEESIIRTVHRIGYKLEQPSGLRQGSG